MRVFWVILFIAFVARVGAQATLQHQVQKIDTKTQQTITKDTSIKRDAYPKQLSLGVGIGNMFKLIDHKDNRNNKGSFFVYDINLRQAITPKFALQVEYFRYRRISYGSNLINGGSNASGVGCLNHKADMIKLKGLFHRDVMERKYAFWEVGFVGFYNKAQKTTSLKRMI